jgi:NAD(P)-dependent dehydrogenase (short-subunit alcohol dehydrogenase family)
VNSRTLLLAESPDDFVRLGVHQRRDLAEKLAAAAHFPACAKASYITGSVLKIDGGIF